MGIDDKFTLVNGETGDEFCQTATVSAYGQLECLTVAQDLDSPINLKVKLEDTGETYDCAAPSDSDCQLQTFDKNSNQMTVLTSSLQSQ